MFLYNTNYTFLKIQFCNIKKNNNHIKFSNLIFITRNSSIYLQLWKDHIQEVVLLKVFFPLVC